MYPGGGLDKSGKWRVEVGRVADIATGFLNWTTPAMAEVCLYSSMVGICLGRLEFPERIVGP